ncbi:hypothetical protein Q1695_011036 [Nippostrongylus brasiliensis]|nr:hypothetical protein Q1695_011036 [Nippostrongylus brasiliensis]
MEVVDNVNARKSGSCGFHLVYTDKQLPQMLPSTNKFPRRKPKYSTEHRGKTNESGTPRDDHRRERREPMIDDLVW